MSDELHKKHEHLRALLSDMESVVVAFSGGVDSALLLAVASQVLGPRCVALTAVSPSLAPAELEACTRLCQQLGVRHELRDTGELADARYARNPQDRCYYCKSHLFDAALTLCEELGFAHVVLGTNVDDLGDHRPGLRAAGERGGRSPMVDAGLSKADVRALAQQLGLDVWDKPAMACLASRFPYGTSITAQRLQRIAACEALLTELGFSGIRARYHDDTVRLELPTEQLAHALQPAVREAIVAGCKAQGFLYVALDLEGYRSGALNAALAKS